jgi:glucose-6-phosphate isomerase
MPWQQLSALASQLPPLRELVRAPGRDRLQLGAAGITLDYSHQAVNDEVLQQLQALADACGVMDKARDMFRGDRINPTEDRAVLHVALRGGEQDHPPWGTDIATQVRTELARFTQFAERVRAGQLSGYRDTPITDIVNLGIGGSDLGPRLCTEALAPWAAAQPAGVKVHFVSNLDAWSLHSTLASLEPSRTAFVVQSKSFTTPETLLLAASAQRWLQDAGCPADRQARHLIAVTARHDLALAAGYNADHIFHLWDWVGGRYSVWSAIGLPVAMAVGAKGFHALLSGARAMDDHFMGSPGANNLPLLLALLGIWNINFMGSSTHLVAPYAFALSRLPAYLQQLDMESNGKRTHRDGSPVGFATAPIVWGGLGLDGQHAYYQLLHQGRHRVPLDFIGVRTDATPLPLASQHHHAVLNNLLAQAKALAEGRDEVTTSHLLLTQGLDADAAARLAPHRTYPGNTPSNLLWMEALTPEALGALIALYEHKVFCQAAIWDICAFDQWGVELGKTLLSSIDAAHTR